MADKSLRFAGDVKINEIVIRSLNGQVANITNQVEAINIYEDLFSSYICASITIIESVDYINLFPFCGEEFVTIDIDTPGLDVPIKGKFYITKIDNYMRIKEREAAYILRCVSEEWYTDANKKINRSLKGNVAEIAALLLSKEGLPTTKKVNVEKTINSTKFIANYWSPSKCLNYATTTAVNLNNSPSYIFFENRNGFNFVSIDSLIKASEKFSFIKDNYSRDTTNNSTVANFNEDFKRIISFDVPVISDYVDNIDNAQLKSRMITHDITTKRYGAIDYSVKVDKNSPSLLNKYPVYSKRALVSAASNIFHMPKYTSNFTNYSDVTNAKTVQRRMSTLQLLKKYTMVLEVLGRTDYTVGMVVDVKIPKATQIAKEDDDKDMILSGKYLVSAINHNINRTNHTCTMELVKNSLLIDLDKR
jgi:hypothetical protein